MSLNKVPLASKFLTICVLASCAREVCSTENQSTYEEADWSFSLNGVSRLPDRHSHIAHVFDGLSFRMRLPEGSFSFRRELFAEEIEEDQLYLLEEELCFDEAGTDSTPSWCVAATGDALFSRYERECLEVCENGECKEMCLKSFEVQVNLSADTPDGPLKFVGTTVQEDSLVEECVECYGEEDCEYYR